MNSMRTGFPLLILAATGSLYFLLSTSPQTKSVEVHKQAARPAAKRISDTPGKNGRLDFSGGEKLKFRKPQRDLFSPLYPPPPVPVRVKKAPEVKAPPATVIVAAPPVVTKPVTAPPRIERMPTFQVLGFLEKGDQLTAFVSLADAIYLVKKEQQFAEGYRVEALDRDLITITRNDGTGRVSIPLRETSGASGRSSRTAVPPLVRPGNHPPFSRGN